MMLINEYLAPVRRSAASDAGAVWNARRSLAEIIDCRHRCPTDTRHRRLRVELVKGRKLFPSYCVQSALV